MHKINHAAICRVYAEELLDEPAVSKCLRAAADEIDLLNKSEKTWCEDSAETDTVVRDAARKVLPEIKVDGDSCHVPSIEDIVELLVAEVERLRLSEEERESVQRAAAFLTELAARYGGGE